MGEVIEVARKSNLANGLGSFSKFLTGVADSYFVEKSRIGFARVCDETSAESGLTHACFSKNVFEREWLTKPSKDEQDCTLN